MGVSELCAYFVWGYEGRYMGNGDECGCLLNRAGKVWNLFESGTQRSRLRSTNLRFATFGPCCGR